MDQENKAPMSLNNFVMPSLVKEEENNFDMNIALNAQTTESLDTVIQVSPNVTLNWDETKKDVWIRQKPKFAITNDPLLDERHDTYQSFMNKKIKIVYQ